MSWARLAAVAFGGTALLVANGGSLAASPTEQRWKLALTSNREGDSEIYSMNANGTGVRKLTRTTRYDGAGPWSPNGRKPLFYSQRSPGGDVWVMNADGSGQRNLTRNRARLRRWVVAERHEDRLQQQPRRQQRALRHERRRERADPRTEPVLGGIRRRLVARRTDDPVRDRPRRQPGAVRDGRRRSQLAQPDAAPGNDSQGGAVWSPDGRRIVFGSTRDTRDDDNFDLYVMNADGSGVRRLTRSPQSEFVFSWSPDGRQLAFGRLPVRPRWAFFVMNADGSGVRKVDWSLPQGGREAARPRSRGRARRGRDGLFRRRWRQGRRVEPGARAVVNPVGKPVTLTLVTVDDTWASEFAAAASRLSGGSIRIRVRVGGSWLLDYERRLVDDVRAGKAELASVGARAWDRMGVTAFQGLVAPFLVDSLELQQRILAGGRPARMLESVEPLELVGVALLPGVLRRPLGVSRELVGPRTTPGRRSGSGSGAWRKRRPRHSARGPSRTASAPSARPTGRSWT